MYCINEWYYFIGVLDKNTCDKIINLAKGKWKTAEIAAGYTPTDAERLTGRPSHQLSQVNENERICNVRWINEKWLYDTIWSIMEEANIRAGWKYDISGAEDMQITRYKKGGFFNFHKDGFSDNLSVYNEPDRKVLYGNVRKLSMTVLLNDNYEGGEFQFATYGKEKCTISTPEFNKTGSIIVFPSDVEHRVASVTKGIRYSLVAWFVGPPFK